MDPPAFKVIVMTAHLTFSARSLGRLLCASAALAALTATTASAVSPKELIELTRAGLSDEVIVALVEADQGGVRLDAAQILMLRNGGVSERVILAMLDKQRQQADAEAAAQAIAPPPLEPAPVVEPAPEPAPVVVQQVPVAVPIYIPWNPVHVPSARAPTIPRSGFGRFINNGWVDGTLPGARR
jgi:hypothetical protein